MKKYFWTLSLLWIAVTSLTAQSDAANLEKYWKFRTDFREKFVKIGSQQGESLPAGALKPLDCVDNDPFPGDTPYGEMHWGDGMIRHGHYLGLLATEYKLLKNSGKDVNGVLNELYYALEAINRLDYSAEEQQDGFYSMTLDPDKNGFFLREDVGEDFATVNWSTDPLRMACTNSAYYQNNNYAKVSNEPGKVVKFNSYQNTPSLDQLTSLMVGFSLIHKLVDDVYVKPTATDDGFYVVAETKAIVDRMIGYAANHNWFLIDVNGWPVNSGGGDLILMAVPLSIAAQRITGNIYPLSTARRLVGYRDIQACATGYSLKRELTEPERADTCLHLGYAEQFHYGEYLSNSGEAGEFNNQSFSEFQTWQLTGITLEEGFHSASLLAWSGLTPNGVPIIDTYIELLGDYAEGTTSDFDNFLIDQGVEDYSETIMFNCGVLSQLWNEENVLAFSEYTKNTQLELINSVLSGTVPLRPQSFYRAKLDEMPATGPFQLKGQNWDPDTANIYNQIEFAPNGWASEYRWTHPNEASGNHSDVNGIYSALDYMLFHNLYRLLFLNGVSSAETNSNCNCTPAPTYGPPSGANSYQLDATANLNQKAAFLPTCPEEVLAPVNHSVSGVYTIQPKFADYVDLGIFTTKYQRSNATVQNGGNLRVRTRFVQCSNGLTIRPTGKMSIDKAETVFGYGTTLDVSGDLRVRAGATLTVRGKLILRQGASLLIDDGATFFLDAAGSIEYYNGAAFTTSGTSSVVHLAGKVKTMNATVFSIESGQAANTNRGKVILYPSTLFEAAATSTFEFKGTGKDIDFIEIRGTGTLNSNSTNTAIKISDCSVRMMQSSGWSTTKKFQCSNVKFYSTSTNNGLRMRGNNHFATCSFVNVPLIGDFSLSGVTDKLVANGCTFENNGVYQNTENYLVKVSATGYAMEGCSFTTSTGTNQLMSSSLTLSSSLGTCSFTQNATGTNRTVCAVKETSNVELVMKSCTFNQLATGVIKNYGKLSLKCTTFDNVLTNNLNIANGALLNMSSTDLAGYNVLQAPTSGNSIVLSQSNIALKNGYNYISDAGSNYCISGTVAVSCVPPSCIIDAAKNQWNSGNTAPSPTKFSVVNGQSYIMLVQTDPVFSKPTCGYYDEPITEVPPKQTGMKPAAGGIEVQTKSAIAEDGMPIIYFDFIGDSARLDDVVYYGISQTTAYNDSLGDNLQAIAIFDQVFNNELNMLDSNAYAYSWLAFEYMKSALENAVASGFITENQNSEAFEEHVGMYVNALMQLTDSVITPENYLTQFYLEFDKAHLFRVIGHPEIGLALLNELEYCGIDAVQQKQLNDWKTIFESDIVIEQIGATAIDSVIVVDTSGFIPPSEAINAYAFGAIIHNLTDIEYPNCAFYNNRSLKADDALWVYPNPASQEVTVQFPKTMTGIAVLEIQHIDGRKWMQETVSLTEEGLTIDLSTLSPGSYYVTLYSTTGKTCSAKLIIR